MLFTSFRAEPPQPIHLHIAHRDELRIDQRVARVVAQRCAVQGEHRAAGFAQHALRRGGVPLRSRAQSQIKSASPRAIKQNFNDEPIEISRCSPSFASIAPVRSRACERLPATTGIPGAVRVLIGRGIAPGARSTNAPSPCSAKYNSPGTGANTTPSTGA